MIAHHEIALFWYSNRPEIADVLVLRWNVRLRNNLSVHAQNSLANLDRFSWKRDHPFDERLRAIQRIPKHHHIAPMNRFEPVDKLVDEYALLVGKKRRHTSAFDFYRLVKENDDDQS